MNSPPAQADWLVARPIAHRGLHAKARGIIENSYAAADAAIAGDYAIECDVQMSKDGEAIVFHDETLNRLTAFEGNLCDLTAHELAAVPLRGSSDKIPLLADFLAHIGGRVPVIVEIKSRFDGDLRLAERTHALVGDYPGPLALQSFDPDVLKFLRIETVQRPLGLIAQAHYDAGEWQALPAPARERLAAFGDYAAIKPDFLAWPVGELPHATPTWWRDGLHLPLLTWTVRDPAQAERAARFADQMIFEGFAP